MQQMQDLRDLKLSAQTPAESIPAESIPLESIPVEVAIDAPAVEGATDTPSMDAAVLAGMQRCAGCGGFGAGLVQADGYCRHCSRQREGGAPAAAGDGEGGRQAGIGSCSGDSTGAGSHACCCDSQEGGHTDHDHSHEEVPVDKIITESASVEERRARITHLEKTAATIQKKMKKYEDELAVLQGELANTADEGKQAAMQNLIKQLNKEVKKLVVKSKKKEEELFLVRNQTAEEYSNSKGVTVGVRQGGVSQTGAAGYDPNVDLLWKIPKEEPKAQHMSEGLFNTEFQRSNADVWSDAKRQSQQNMQYM